MEEDPDDVLAREEAEWEAVQEAAAAAKAKAEAKIETRELAKFRQQTYKDLLEEFNEDEEDEDSEPRGNAFTAAALAAVRGTSESRKQIAIFRIQGAWRRALRYRKEVRSSIRIQKHARGMPMRLAMRAIRKQWAAERERTEREAAAHEAAKYDPYAHRRDRESRDSGYAGITEWGKDEERGENEEGEQDPVIASPIRNPNQRSGSPAHELSPLVSPQSSFYGAADRRDHRSRPWTEASPSRWQQNVSSRPWTVSDADATARLPKLQQEARYLKRKQRPPSALWRRQQL